MEIKPFNHGLALDGYHCVTNSLAKIFHFNKHPLSEDMLLGLGAGMGFIYWRMKGNPKIGISEFVFIGGRGNIKNFFQDIEKRTGVKIIVKSTASENKAEAAIIEKLQNKEPVMVYGDMGFLPWFDFPKDYHFGGHSFVICGYDGRDHVLSSDMDPKASGLKKGFYYPISLDQLRKARGSTYKPFPPRNTYLEFDFKNYHYPKTEDIYSAIKQTAELQLNPPIKNIGIKGMRHTAKELMKWPNIFKDKELRKNLFGLYIFIEIGGTGGGCFRYMYSRFLKESTKITGNNELEKVSKMIYESGQMFTEVGLLFKDAETSKDIKERIKIASEKFNKIADMEEKAFDYLSMELK
ncbi:MAG: BtrH N-terminal domain-containing protein [Candidatus Firestonebacteria bacterium]